MKNTDLKTFIREGVKNVLKETTYAGKDAKDDLEKDAKFSSLSADAKEKAESDLDKGGAVTVGENKENDIWEKIDSEIDDLFEKHTEATGGGYEADYTDKQAFINDLIEYIKKNFDLKSKIDEAKKEKEEPEKEDTWHKPDTDDEGTDEDKLDKKAKAGAKKLSGKSAKLDKVIKGLAQVNTEMQALAKEYKDAKTTADRKAQIVGILKVKTANKKELEKHKTKMENELV